MFGIFNPMATRQNEILSELENLKQAYPQPDGSDIPWNMALSAAQAVVRGVEPNRMYIFKINNDEEEKEVRRQEKHNEDYTNLDEVFKQARGYRRD